MQPPNNFVKVAHRISGVSEAQSVSALVSLNSVRFARLKMVGISIRVPGWVTLRVLETDREVSVPRTSSCLLFGPLVPTCDAELMLKNDSSSE